MVSHTENDKSSEFSLGETLGLKTKVDRLVVEKEVAKTNHARLMISVEENEQHHLNVEEAQRLAQSVAKTVQEQAHSQISKVVSRCLSTTFDNPYKFRVVFEEKRGRTEARLVFLRDELEVDPMTASGGGVLDVGAFALRLACLMLSRPRLRRVLILDEPFRFVSREYRGRIRALLEGLAEEMGVQFIMVTHIKDLMMGTVVELD